MDKTDKNKVNETLNSCITIVSKTLKEATDTSIEIKTQGDQFQKMDDRTEDIKDNTKKANGILDKMLSYVGYIRDNTKKKIKKNQIIDENSLKVDEHISKLFEPPKNPIYRVANQEELILEDCNEDESIIEYTLEILEPTSEEERRQEKDDKLQTLYNLTKQLKEVNLGINSSLDNQNNTTFQLDTKVEDRTVDIRKTNRKIKQFLR